MPRLRYQAILAGGIALLGLPSAGAEPGAAVFSPESFADGGDIEHLTRSTFISSVLESSAPAVVWLYSGSDCPQCETVLPFFKEAAGKLSSWGMTIAAVDLSKETRLRRDLSIPKGLPMMFKVYHSASTPNPYGGLPVRTEELITMFQDARSLQKKVLTAIPDSVVSIDLKDGSALSLSKLKTALAEEGEGDFAVVLFTETGKASPVLRVLANQVKGNKVSAFQARLPKRRGSADEDGSANEREASEGGGGEETSAEEALKKLLEGVVDIQPKGTDVTVPCLVLVDKRSGTGAVYGGGTAVDDAKALLAFIRDGTGLSSDPSPGTTDSSGDSDGGGGANKNKFGAPLKLDPALLTTLAEEGTEALVVAFVEGRDLDSIPGWGEATKALQGQVRAAVFDCTAYPDECSSSSGSSSSSQGQKTKAPHIRVYPHGLGVDGDKRGFPSVLPPSEVKAAVSEAEASLPELVTVIPAGVDNQRVQDAIQAFIGANIFSEGSPMCLLVLSRREEPNLVVKTVSAAFHQPARVKTMFISNPDEELLAGLGVFKLPAMMLMYPQQEGLHVQVDPNQRKPAPGEKALVTAHYSPTHWGPVSHEHVSEFIMSHLSRVDTDAFIRHVRGMSETAKLNAEELPVQLERFLAEFGESEETDSAAAGGDNAAGTGADRGGGAPISFQGVPEVTSEAWATITGAAGGGQHSPRSVGVFFLDRFSDTFASAFETAEKASEIVAGRLGSSSGGGEGARFVWVDAPCQEGFAGALGVADASEVPALVVYSPKHKKSAKFVGAWEPTSVGSFLAKALGGRAPLFPIGGDEAPRLDESLDCSHRPPPAWLSRGDGGVGGGEGGEDTVGDDDLGDLMAEILAEEAKAKRELEEEVARGLKEAEEKEAAAAAAASKRTKKTVKKKKKKSAGGGGRTEL